MFPDNGPPAPDQNDPQAPPAARNTREKPKKPRESVVLKPQLFQTKKGLRSLYERTKQLKLDDHSQINVENTMKKLVVLLKSWHFQMVPKYSFDLFIQRCQVLGTHKRLTAYMSKVRKIHKGQDTWQQAGNQAAQNMQPNPQEERQQLYNGRMFQQNNQALKMMSNYAIQPTASRPQMQQMDEEDDQQLMQLMYQVQKKHNKPKDSEEGESNQPYVPQGFQVQFQDQEEN